jgi:general stress protein YciG
MCCFKMLIMAKTRKDFATEFARSGGKARAKALTPEQRKQIASKAAKARWAKKKKANQ